MDDWTMLDEFAARYAAAMKSAQKYDDWNERAEVQRDAERTLREMRKIVSAVDTLIRHNVLI